MSVDLSLIIADLENKIAAADSNTPILNLLQMITAAERLTGGKNVYDSAGVLPTGNEYIGTIAMTADGTIRVYSGDSGGWDTLDSSTYVATSYSFQGSTSGYASGGATPTLQNVIDKFPFAIDGNATDVGDLTVSRRDVRGQSSANSGYTSGGFIPPTSVVNTIDKFPFAVDGNATDVGDLTVSRRGGAGQSSSDNGYTSGGYSPPTYLNTIDKFPFSTDANATDVGDLTIARGFSAEQSSTVSGYTAGGASPAPSNVIDKFPFSTDGNATDVGDLTNSIYHPVGQSSSENGYTSGGAPFTNIIDKFPFAVDANATDVGDLIFSMYGSSGQSSTVSGYTAGGYIFPASPGNTNIISKFPFSTDANATDVGDITVTRLSLAGQQV